jgi:hypothetical protein
MPANSSQGGKFRPDGPHQGRTTKVEKNPSNFNVNSANFSQSSLVARPRCDRWIAIYKLRQQHLNGKAAWIAARVGGGNT